MFAHASTVGGARFLMVPLFHELHASHILNQGQTAVPAQKFDPLLPSNSPRTTWRLDGVPCGLVTQLLFLLVTQRTQQSPQTVTAAGLDLLLLTGRMLASRCGGRSLGSSSLGSGTIFGRSSQTHVCCCQQRPLRL
jgi:hypothetical protein